MSADGSFEDEGVEFVEPSQAAAGADVEDDPFDVYDAGDGFEFGLSLWDGDEGTLTDKERDTLVVLLKQEYVSSDSNPKEFKTLLENPSRIRSMLNNVYLELHLDHVREVAYKRPVRAEGRKFRTILYDTSYNREETLLLVYLREQLRAGGVTGAAHVSVDAGDMQEYVARFRPKHDTNEAGGRKKVENAIDALKRAKLLLPAPGGDTDRFQISRAIETLLPVERLNALLEALRNQSDSQTDAIEPPTEPSQTEAADV